MKSIDKLQDAGDLSDLAKCLGYYPSALSYILYKIPNPDKYTTFKVPKKSGGEREIKAPVSHLKKLQCRLADLLQDCFEEIYKKKSDQRSLAHGFRKNHSIITNAYNHRNKRYVFNVDLKDFFPSINFGRVRGFFIKSNDFQLAPEVATVIAQIACHDNELPQGSPLSPIVSNLIGHILDIRLVRIAKKAKCTYSRYADDITFSSREKNFPILIAEQQKTGEWVPGKKLDAVIKRAGFDINPQKVSMQFQINRQMVTGLVVNRKVNIRAAYYRQARAMCNKLFRTGQFHFGKEMQRVGSKGNSPFVPGSVNQLRGILGHIYHVKRHHDKRNAKDKREKPTAIHNLCQRFLYFDKFHNLSKPLILCEGKTDSIYLKCALKSLAANFPTMIDVTGPNLEWKVDFFKYSKFNMDLMQSSGGTGNFQRFIYRYKMQMEPFLCHGQAFPVILLVDMDSGAKEVLTAAEKISKRTVNGNDDFYHLVDNLYLVTLPIPAGKKEVTIEDYFADSVKSTRLHGKSFNPGKSFDENNNYGKYFFAEHVIKANQANIVFFGFKPLLERITKAIEDYQSSMQGLL